MKNYKKQTQKSVSSFEWQWVEKKVRDSRKNFYRRLFRDIGIYTSYFDRVGYFDLETCLGYKCHLKKLFPLN